MSEVGCWITVDNGDSYYNLNGGGARCISFLQRLKVAPDKTSYTFNIANKAANSSLFVIPITGGKVYQGANSAVPRGVGVSDILIDNANVTIKFSNTKLEGQGSIDSDPWFYFDVYQSVDSGENYGIYFSSDITSFSSITDASTSGLCVHKETIKVSESWSVPSSIEGYSNCCVCASWDSQDAVVEFSNSEKKITVSGGPLSLNVAVFSNGFNLRMPDYGIFIYNSSGVCTFNSLYIPFFIKKSFTVNDSWQSSGLSNPMIPLCVTGIDKTSIGGNLIQTWNKGIMMSGGNVKTGRGKRLNQFDTQGYGVTFPSSKFQTYILDGSQYF